MDQVIRLAGVFGLAAALVTPLAAETGFLSDDGDVVTVAKIPNALKLSSFANHLGIAAHGTRARND